MEQVFLNQMNNKPVKNSPLSGVANGKIMFGSPSGLGYNTVFSKENTTKHTVLVNRDTTKKGGRSEIKFRTAVMSAPTY